MADAEAGKLIVDFPTDHQHSRSVHFANTSKLYIVPRHVDYEDVRRQDLWYIKADYYHMRLARQISVLQVRAMVSAGIPISYLGAGDDGPSDEDDCLVGIEHLLTPATIREVMACRRRCVRVVLEEQARQRQRMNPPDTTGWDSIAIASIAETRRARFTAHELGKLQASS